MHKIIVTTEEELEYIIRKVLTGILSPIMTNGILGTLTPEPEIMTITQASAFLSIAKQTLYHYTSTRAIPHFKRGKKLYFKKHELIEWLTEHKQLTLDERLAEWEKNQSSRKKR
jgi:excisionase family DNA binding protein